MVDCRWLPDVSRYGPALAAALVLAFVTTQAAPAQDTGTGDGGIETRPLDPLPQPQPPGEGGDSVPLSGGRFQPAPFTTPAIPVEPELIRPIDTAHRSGARLRQLDKMTGRIQTVEIAAGAEQMIDRILVRLETCRSPTDNAQHGTMAFLQIWDTKRAEPEPVFSGWMFAESPALSALDHPRYDLWVISCTTASGEAPVASE